MSDLSFKQQVVVAIVNNSKDLLDHFANLEDACKAFDIEVPEKMSQFVGEYKPEDIARVSLEVKSKAIVQLADAIVKETNRLGNN